MKLPPLSALRTFEATARRSSFSKAADELCVTHSAVSHQIKNLEDWFATKLFERKGRGVQLTRSGERLFRHVSPALTDMAEACARIKALGKRETLTIGCIPSIASRWLVPNLNQFTETRPRLDVRVVYATAREKITDGDLDILIATEEEKAAGIGAARLFSRINKPVCSPLFLRRYGPFDPPDRIASAPLLHDENREGWRNWFKTAGVRWDTHDNWPVYEDFNLLATAVIAGHGIALCPVEVFRMEIARGDLVVLSDVSENAESAYFASYRKNPTKASEEFIAWFAQFV